MFYTLEKSWISAKDLEPGDTVVTLSGEKYKIETIDKDYYDGIIVVYNFEVEDNHNYYVGDNKVLVHNDGGCTVSDKGSSGGGTNALSKNAELLRTGGNNTTVNVRTRAEANLLLQEAFPDYQKVNGVGPQDASGIRKKTKMDRFKQGGAYHKDYAIDAETGNVRGHNDTNEHGAYPHINIKRVDGKKVLINIVRN
ncbi:MAG: hypothetical protein KBG38_05295 [Candidatus Cloacimonas sp.]|nr:hypothetical protein [Candidatus Cloacimonas sp.]